MVVGDFWSEAEREVLSVSHFVFVHCAYGFNYLKCTQRNISIQQFLGTFLGLFTIILPVTCLFCTCMFKRKLTHTQTYLSWCNSFTHEDFIVGSELWGVVIHVFHFDVNTYFGVLMVASYTHTVQNH